MLGTLIHSLYETVLLVGVPVLLIWLAVRLVRFVRREARLRG